MATAKPKRRSGRRALGKLTAKQDEVKRLIQNGQSIEEVAELMETTPNAVKAQLTRMARLGVKVKPATAQAASPAAGGSVKRPGRATTDDSPERELPPRLQSVEEHLDTELARVTGRLTTIGEILSTLTEEREELDQRKTRLEQARSALSTKHNPSRPGKPALREVA